MKNRKRVIGVLVCIALISSMFLAGYSFARYYKSIKIDTIHTSIARWNFNSKNTLANINLSNEKIAPGSNGQFEIEVDATDSEVPVEYEIKVENETNIPRNMTFYVETKDELGNCLKTEEKNSFAEIAIKELKGIIPVETNNQKRILVVHWNWPFNEEDESSIDSQDATLQIDNEGSSLECGFDIQIVGKQANNS